MLSETPCGWNSIFYKSSNAAFHSVARFIFFISFGQQIGLQLNFLQELQLIEFGESLHAIFVVDDATGFSATVHSEDGIAHINTLQWDGRGEDIAQCAATCYIAMVHEALAWYTGCIADVGEDGC